MEQYVKVYKPNKGDTIQLPFTAFADKGKVGDIAHTIFGSPKLHFKFGDEAFCKINEIPKFIERLKNVWVQKRYILYLCAAERLYDLGIEYEKKSDIQYCFIDYIKTIINMVQTVFRRIYIVKVISD